MYKNYNKFQIKDKGGIRIINNFNYTKKRNEEKKFIQSGICMFMLPF